MGVRSRGPKKNMNASPRGEGGKYLRVILVIAAVIALIVITAVLGKPKNQLMNAAEMKRISDRGVLIVGVRDDVPGFAFEGEGLEIELAMLFADYLLPETESDAAAKLVTVSGQTAATKLSDGSIDVAIALMEKDASSKYAYSYPYYTDTCIVAVNEGGEHAPLTDITIGYVQNTAGANVLNRYISKHETKVERSLIDRIRGITPELPEDAVVFTKKAFASYPDMLTALREGRIGGAVLTGVYADRYRGEFSFSVHDTELGKVEYAITASADEPAAAQLADVFIYELRQSGRLDQLLEKYGLK